METLRRTSRTTLVAATAVLTLVGLSFGYWLTTDDDKEVVGWLIVSAACTLIAAGLLLRLVPSVEADADPGNRPARVGLILGVLSLLAVAVFWTGLPFALGVPALVLGAEGSARAAAQGRGGQATAAVVLASIAIVLTFVGSLFG
jgi:hypothetical protein